MAKKMILVDPRLLESTRQYLPPEPVSDSLRDLDSRMQQIMEMEDLEPRDKARVYQQTLQRYLGRLEQYRQKPLGYVDVKQPPQPSDPQPVAPILKDEEKPLGHQLKPDVEPPSYYLRKKKNSKIPTPKKWDKWP